MKVIEQELPGIPVEALVATDTHDLAGVHEGEVVGYRCECGAGDETLMQVIHDPECELTGRHGRARYCKETIPIVEEATMPELEREHRIDVVTAGWTDDSDGVHNGEPIMFRCGECGNADETLAEIRHDEDCSLAGRHGLTCRESLLMAAADGGRKM